MIDNPFRKHLPKYVKPLIAFYKWTGLTPNHISVLSLFISIYCAWLVATNRLNIALVVWWAGRLLDGTDGIYARQTQQDSTFGAYLDIVCDMASYSLIPIGMLFAYPQYQLQWILMIYFYVLCITSALSLGSLEGASAMAKNDNRGLRLGAGLAEGGETGIAYSVFFIFPGFLNMTSWVWVAILFMTVVSRTLLATKTLIPKR